MNRVIKFKAWDNKHKKIWTLKELLMPIHYDANSFMDLLLEVQINPAIKKWMTINYRYLLDNYDVLDGFTTEEDEWDFSEDFIVLQYTGLKDKNGREIYEGDLVHRHDHWNNCKGVIRRNHEIQEGCDTSADSIETVEFRDGSFQWFPYYESEAGYEIVGNIYENPELLHE